ncbi:MAG: hypothetical protein ACE5J7_02070 [Candidatus Aenigmatarchaeota archaeon]
MQKDVAKFEKKMNWDKTKANEIIKFIKKDARELNTRNAKHKAVDILFECIQLANRKKMNLSNELKKHMKDAGKKYKKINEYCSNCDEMIIVRVRKKDYRKGTFTFRCPECGKSHVSIRVR